ncbi:unnamed protein product, partial [Aphanomyces euteiches]
ERLDCDDEEDDENDSNDQRESQSPSAQNQKADSTRRDLVYNSLFSVKLLLDDTGFKLCFLEG